MALASRLGGVHFFLPHIIPNHTCAYRTVLYFVTMIVLPLPVRDFSRGIPPFYPEDPTCGDPSRLDKDPGGKRCQRPTQRDVACGSALMWNCWQLNIEY